LVVVEQNSGSTRVCTFSLAAEGVRRDRALVTALECAVHWCCQIRPSSTGKLSAEPLASVSICRLLVAGVRSAAVRVGI
jgi:hypothetical protein